MSTLYPLHLLPKLSETTYYPRTFHHIHHHHTTFTPDTPKRKSNKLPFLGRTRKKSTHSQNSSTSTLDHIADYQESTTAHGHRDTPPLGDYPPDHLAFSQLNISSPSLSSKVAQRFSPHKYRHLHIDPAHYPDTQASPSFPSPTSALRPTITVSVPPGDDYVTFDNLFTRPRHVNLAQNDRLHMPPYDFVESSDDDRTGTLGPPYQLDDSSTSDLADPVDPSFIPRQQGPVSRKRKQHHSDSVWREIERGLGTEVDPEESSPDAASWSPKSAQLSSVGPPAFPLPSPPSLPILNDAAREAVDSRNARRHRSHTISSVASTPDLRYASASAAHPTSARSKGKRQAKPPEDPRQEYIDLETATPDELRQALIIQRAQFDDLASYLVNMTEKHAMEKTSLVKKIDSLEKEARKAGRELKGLRYLVMHGTGFGSVSPRSSEPRTKKIAFSDDGHSSSPKPSPPMPAAPLSVIPEAPPVPENPHRHSSSSSNSSTYTNVKRGRPPSIGQVLESPIEEEAPRPSSGAAFRDVVAAPMFL